MTRQPNALGTGAAVEMYKSLENAERVFRSLNSDLLIRSLTQTVERSHPCLADVILERWRIITSLP